MFDKVSKIKLNSKNKDLNDIKLLLMSLNPNTIAATKSIKMDNNHEEKININYHTDELDKSEIVYKQLKNNIFQNNKLEALFIQEQIIKSNFPFIFLYKINNKDFQNINHEWCLNNKFILRNINESIYVFQGIIFITQHDQKGILFYEYHSQCWFSFQDKQWSTTLILPNKIQTIYIVYFKINYKETKDIEFENCKKKAQISSNETDHKLYWNAFLTICERNPILIQQNLQIYSDLFSLDNQDNIQKIYYYFDKKGIIEWQEVKNLLTIMQSKFDFNFEKNLFKFYDIILEPIILMKKLKNSIVTPLNILQNSFKKMSSII